ncbi:protein cappuccino-like [Ctenocephalides felis]|uniref:protein cappuccino-like n=1 Tax=Ctenocephalides felis TaxID=7515 RepID=UPI000E6E22DE|nr:protein cappuccino-like [Ctenocephalides felis]
MAPSLRKPPINPPVPMKPLYWTRIITSKPAPVAATEIKKEDLWQDLEEANISNLQKFMNLFSRQVVTKKAPVKKVEKPKKNVAVKILDSKRSQNRATPEELSMIKEHVSKNKEEPLDKPEQFLYDLSEIQCFAERISCFMFQVEFEDSVATLSNTLSNLKSLCEIMLNGKELKQVFGIILKLGNVMNGGNRTRGQADGFGLEILAKLKDVKSKDNQITLLHFIVETYMDESKEEAWNVALPIPNTWDVSRAAEVDFENLAKVIDQLKVKLDACTKRTQKVLDNSSPENIQPFKDKMESFIQNANETINNERTSMQDIKNKFIKTMCFFSFKPKTGPLESCPTNEFFSLWIPFCKDFEQIWKKEQQKRND